MASGSGHLSAALLGFAVVAVAAALVRPKAVAASRDVPAWGLRVRVGVGGIPATLREAFDRHTESVEALAAATGRQGAALDLTYRIRLRPSTDMAAFVAELNSLEGVQGVELSQD
jgi:hypothetical protein